MMTTKNKELEENSEEEENESEEEENEEEENEEEENEDPTAGLKSALEKERAARKKAEKELKQHQKDNEGDSERAIREAKEEAANKYKGLIVKSEAKAELIEAGLKGAPDKLIKLIDLDDIEIDDDGDVVGLDEQINQIKKDFPELFSTDGKKLKPTGKKDTGGSKKSVDSENKKTSAQRIWEQWNEE